MITPSAQLGIGLYTPAEAAFYARVRTQTIKRWLFGDAHGESVVASQLGDTEEKTVTFLDFVQTLAIRAIRIQYKIPLPRIRAAVTKAKDEYQIEYPFASRHTTFLLSDQQKQGHGELVIRVPNDSDEPRLIQLSGRSRGNLLLKEVAEPFLKDLHFDSASGLATEYQPLKSGERWVILDPRRRFGEPVVMPCGYTAQTLFDAIGSEGGIAAAAREYGVDAKDVELAYNYIDHLMTTSV